MKKSKVRQSKDFWQLLQTFEEQNPDVVEAMRLFEISFAEYEQALHGLSAPQIFESSSSAGVAQSN